MNTKLNVGWGYPPSLAYMPFLITGDYYYLEEQLYWASYSFWWGGRHAGGKIVEKDRSPAMYLRTVMNAWSILPDSAPERRYYAERIEASIDSALNHIHTIDKDNQFGVYRVEDVKHENNYFIIGVTDQLARLGFSKAAQWRDFMLRLPVGMLTNHPQFNKFDAINYFSTYIDHQCAPACSEGYRIPSSWADLYQVMLNQTERQAGTENVNMPRKDYYETTYVGYLLYVLGIAARTDFPKGREAYELLYDYYKNDKVNYCVTPLGGCFDSRDWLRTSNQPISAQRSPTLTSPTTAFAVTTTQGMLTVSTASQRAAQVRIFDLAGRRIAARPLLPDSHSGMRSAHVDFRGTSRAMYVVQVNGETSMTKTILLP
jgi:hypothetical protein